MSKQAIKAAINANIKQNGNQEITGQIMNGVLNVMVDDLGSQEELSDLATKSAEIANNDTDADLTFEDEQGNVCLEIAQGEVRAGYFDSRDAIISEDIIDPTNVGEEEPIYAVSDSNGNHILEVGKDGHIRTKNFDSSEGGEGGGGGGTTPSDGTDVNRTIAFAQGNKLINEYRKHPFSWKTRAKGAIGIKSDDLTSDVDLVAKIMADRNLPLHLAAPTKTLNNSVNGITNPSDKIGNTRLDIVRFVIEHGGEILEHSAETFKSPEYYNKYGIYPIFVEQQRIWAELGINVRGSWVANDSPNAECKKALAPYLYYYYEYSNGYGTTAPYNSITKINDGSLSEPTTYEGFKSWIDGIISSKKFGMLTIHGFTRISSTLFNQVLDYVQQKVADGTLEVKLWSDIFDESRN